MERLKFVEYGHKYFGCETGRRFESVSSVAKKISPPVEWEQIKAALARKWGVTVPDIEAWWAVSTLAGTALHAQFEEEILSSEEYEWLGESFIPVPYEVDANDKTIKYQVMNLKPGHVYPELITGLEKDHVRIGGQSDMVLIGKDLRVNISDWKSDKEILTENKYGKFFLGDLSDIPAINFNEYSLKMSLYMFCILRAHPDLKPGRIVLHHRPLLRDERGVPIVEEGTNMPTVVDACDYEIDYATWQPRVRDMLNYYYKITKK